MRVDLDAPEHALCSETIADRDDRIRELNAGLAHATRLAVDRSTEVSRLRAENARLREALDSLYAASEIGSANDAIQRMLAIIDDALAESEEKRT